VRIVPPPKTMQAAEQQERRNIFRGELVALCLLGISISHLRLSCHWEQIPRSLTDRRFIDRILSRTTFRVTAPLVRAYAH